MMRFVLLFTGSFLAFLAAGMGIKSSDGLFVDGVITSTKGFSNYEGTLVHSGTVTLNFDGSQLCNSLTLTGDLVLATINLATNRSYSLRLTNSQATNCSLTLPSWVPIGSALPTVLAAGKAAYFDLIARGSSDSSVDCVYAAQP